MANRGIKSNDYLEALNEKPAGGGGTTNSAAFRYVPNIVERLYSQGSKRTHVPFIKKKLEVASTSESRDLALIVKIPGHGMRGASQGVGPARAWIMPKMCFSTVRIGLVLNDYWIDFQKFAHKSHLLFEISRLHMFSLMSR